MKNKYKEIKINFISVDAQPISDLFSCKREAIKMCIEMETDIILIHNGHEFDVIYTRIMDSIERR